MAVVKFLLDTPRTDLNATDNKGSTALLSVVSLHNEEIVTLLLAAWNLCESEGGYGGMNALHVAVGQYQGLNMLKLLLEHPVEINVTDDRGKTALHHACWGSTTDLLTSSCSKGAVRLP